MLASERTELENYWLPVLKQNRSQPLVDFSKDRIVIIFLGSRNTSGYSAQVRDVINQGGTSALVCVDELTPGPKQKTTQSLTSPWVMIAIDRSYLDISAKIQKVEDNRLPSFQINPLTTFTPIPWSPCGYGYGGGWSDPCGYGFDSPMEFQSWCERNRCDLPLGYNQIDFSVNRLFFISAGDYGLGFGLQIGDVFMSGSTAVVQVRRGGASNSRSQRSYVLASISKQTQNVMVEYLVNSDECYLGTGINFPMATAGTMVASSRQDYDRLTGKNLVGMPNSISEFDYTNANLGIAYLGRLNPGLGYVIDRVAYRGPTAMIYVKKSLSSGGVINFTQPYFAFRLPKKVTGIKVIDAS